MPNMFLKQAFETGVAAAHQEAGLTKQAIWPYLVPAAAGAGLGALMGGEGNRMRGAAMGGLAGLGLAGGARLGMGKPLTRAGFEAASAGRLGLGAAGGLGGAVAGGMSGGLIPKNEESSSLLGLIPEAMGQLQGLAPMAQEAMGAAGYDMPPALWRQILAQRSAAGLRGNIGEPDFWLTPPSAEQQAEQQYEPLPEEQSI
jgi:hypothetical protein